MTRKKIISLLKILFPVFLLVVFCVFMAISAKLPFIPIHTASYPGIGTETFAVPGERKMDQKVKFNMKRVPAGVAPGGCIDIPGITRVNAPFLLGETEVTSELWHAVLARAEATGYVFTAKGLASANKLFPAEGVTWRDAVVWCNALSEELGLVPVYYADASYTAPLRSVPVLAESKDLIFVRESMNGFRLPFSAEWELAARYIDGNQWTPGGNPSGSPYSYYNGSYADNYAIFQEEKPFPVKSRASNRLGLYDMSGSVWEWCFDTLGEPTASEGKFNHVVRGGSWRTNAYRLQIGGAFGTLPDAVESGQGFRIARSGW